METNRLALSVLALGLFGGAALAQTGVAGFKTINSITSTTVDAADTQRTGVQGFGTNYNAPGYTLNFKSELVSALDLTSSALKFNWLPPIKI